MRNKLSHSFENIVLLKTCQRIELYLISGKTTEELEKSFRDIYGKYFNDDFINRLKPFHSKEGFGHLVRMAAGFESFINGENEIYDQIKNLSDKYHEDGLAGDFMKSIFNHALDMAKDARKITEVDVKVQSYPELSFELAKTENTYPKKILVIGAGLLARSVAEFWQKESVGVEIFDGQKTTSDAFDFIINCDSKTEVELLTRLPGKIIIDFSIPALIDSTSNPSNYFSIKNFKHIIEKNNEQMKLSIEESVRYIDREISAL